MLLYLAKRKVVVLFKMVVESIGRTNDLGKMEREIKDNAWLYEWWIGDGAIYWEREDKEQFARMNSRILFCLRYN